MSKAGCVLTVCLLTAKNNSLCGCYHNIVNFLLFAESKRASPNIFCKSSYIKMHTTMCSPSVVGWASCLTSRTINLINSISRWKPI